MKYQIYIFIISAVSIMLPNEYLFADYIFKNSSINIFHKQKFEKYFSVGTIQSARGKNYIPLRNDLRNHYIDLSEKGYYELTADNLINTDLQLKLINNETSGDFKIKFFYDEKALDFNYEIKKGDIEIKIDLTATYPCLIIRQRKKTSKKYYLNITQNNMPVGKSICLLYDNMTIPFIRDDSLLFFTINEELAEKDIKIQIDSFQYDCSMKENFFHYMPKPFVFFDFNHPLNSLLNYYADIEKLLKNSKYYSFYYSYKKDDPSISDLFFYQNISHIEQEKAGLFGEKKEVHYYLKIFEGIRSRFGRNIHFTDKIYIISKYGDKLISELNQSLQEMKIDINVFWISYDKLPITGL